MGRHKFRLSDMIPNAWFFKLRDMRAARGPASPGGPSRAGRLPSTPRQHGASSSLPHRASYYYSPRAGDPAVESPLHTKAADTPFPPLPLTPPRRSCSKRRHRRRSVRLAPSASGSSGVSSPADAGCHCRRRPAVEPPDTPPCRRDNFVGYDDDDDDDGAKPTVTVPADYDLGGKVITSATDIIIDLRTRKRPDKVLLPPIITKPSRRETADGYEPEDKHMDGTQRTAAVSQPSKAKPRRSVSSSSARRLKTRANTPRVASPKKPKPPPARTAKAPPLAESFAVVKTSRDPRRDFRESMEEMIAENAICDAADLEDLLACYLSLNAAEYHDLIVDVFERIWAGRAGVDM